MEFFLNYQNHIEGMLILCSFLIGSYFLFTDNIEHLENAGSGKHDVNSINDSLDKVGDYFKELLSFLTGLILGSIFNKNPPSDNIGTALRLALTIPLAVLIISISGYIGKSISKHWMNMNNGFHFGLKNCWTPSCSPEDYENNLFTSGENEVQSRINSRYKKIQLVITRYKENSIEEKRLKKDLDSLITNNLVSKRQNDSLHSLIAQAKIAKKDNMQSLQKNIYEHAAFDLLLNKTNDQPNSRIRVILYGLFTSGTIIDDDDIKRQSFNLLFPQYRQNGLYCFVDTSCLNYNAKSKDTSYRFRTQELIAKPTARSGNYFVLRDSVHYISLNSELNIVSFHDSTTIRKILKKYIYEIKDRDKIQLYHYAKNYYVQNSPDNKDVVTKIDEKESIINFSRTLALSFYILFFFMFLNLVLSLCRSLRKNKKEVFWLLIIVFTSMYITKTYYLINIATLLVIATAVLSYFSNYRSNIRKLTKKNVDATESDKNRDKAKRLSMLLSILLTVFALGGYLISSVNWKVRENDANLYVLGNFKNSLLTPRTNDKIHKSVYNILLPVCTPGIIYKKQTDPLKPAWRDTVAIDKSAGLARY